MIVLINHPPNLVAILANNTENPFLFIVILCLPCIQKGFGCIEVRSSSTGSVGLPNVEHQELRLGGLRLCHMKLHLRA